MQKKMDVINIESEKKNSASSIKDLWCPLVYILLYIYLSKNVLTHLGNIRISYKSILEHLYFCVSSFIFMIGIMTLLSIIGTKIPKKLVIFSFFSFSVISVPFLCFIFKDKQKFIQNSTIYVITCAGIFVFFLVVSILMFLFYFRNKIAYNIVLIDSVRDFLRSEIFDIFMAFTFLYFKSYLFISLSRGIQNLNPEDNIFNSFLTYFLGCWAFLVIVKGTRAFLSFSMYNKITGTTRSRTVKDTIYILGTVYLAALIFPFIFIFKRIKRPRIRESDSKIIYFLKSIYDFPLSVIHFFIKDAIVYDNPLIMIYAAVNNLPYFDAMYDSYKLYIHSNTKRLCDDIKIYECFMPFILLLSATTTYFFNEHQIFKKYTFESSLPIISLFLLCFLELIYTSSQFLVYFYVIKPEELRNMNPELFNIYDRSLTDKRYFNLQESEKYNILSVS
ncbi:hypothetical protein CWI39_0027p0030 [Hamiltosporidium magnivora]|uniref:Transmembrane protein n=1 Tax=Hamiltosporidium magnivora TaxID=148818 RepID=A0A4Q9LKU2_9MICR|nr:hypothetical protein CWI36_0093p0020 [Hamiltosporidium magnivora]TBU09866.1 hypothetical protein CWI39_0027p0030 [Hamiltosporidium magnivora]